MRSYRRSALWESQTETAYTRIRWVRIRENLDYELPDRITDACYYECLRLARSHPNEVYSTPSAAPG